MVANSQIPNLPLDFASQAFRIHGNDVASFPGYEERLVEAGLHSASCMFKPLPDDLPCSFIWRSGHKRGGAASRGQVFLN